MSDSEIFDLAIIGGGIVGLATARALLATCPLRLALLEAEPRLAAHQTGNNSGVIHSGLYYRPGSLKARNCVAGREALYAFCERYGIHHEHCGKLVVATQERELPALADLEQRGRENGLEGLQRVGPEEIREHEPHVSGIAGLWVPQTGIVDFGEVAGVLGRLIREAGGKIMLSARLEQVRVRDDELHLSTPAGPLRARALINCAGLYSDRVARMCGVRPGLRIIPFRGEYYELRPEQRHLVRNLVYPVPDERFPFLGVHFTRGVTGVVEAGPNAVLAFKREGYTKFSFSLRDTLEMALYGGAWRMAWSYWKIGVGEFYRSFNKRAFVRALQRLVPEIRANDLFPGGAGVRAQALEPDGALVDDFRIVEAPRMVHVLNAPSPAATAAISIGETIAEMARTRFHLG